MRALIDKLSVGAAAAQRGRDTPVRLHGGWLALARILYTLLLLTGVTLFALSSWIQFSAGLAPCTDPVHANWTFCTPFRQAQAQLGLTPALYEGYFLAVRILASLPLLAVSLLLAWRQGSELRVLLLAALLAVAAVAGPWFNPLWEWAGGWLRESTAVPFLGTAAHLLTYVLQVGGLLFLFLFPSGRFLPVWSRWLALAWLVLAFFAVFFPESPLAYAAWPAAASSAVPLLFVSSGVGATIYRYRRQASPVERQQIKWIVAGLLLLSAVWLMDYVVWNVYPSLSGTSLIGEGIPSVVWELVQDTAWYSAQIILRLCFGLAILRRRLWDIDLILNRTLVYATLTLSVVGLYVLVVGSLGAAFQARNNLLVSLLATGLIAVLFQPLRERLQRVVNRLLFGDRDDPVTLLSRLGAGLEMATTPAALMGNLVATVASALKLPYAAVEIDGQVVAAAGQAAGETQRLPLIYQAQVLGHLLLSPRAAGESFGSADRRLLETVAHQAGAAAQAVRLTSALQRSRQRIVTAREEERRRLHRDLHDGLGPQLASQTLGLDAVERLIESDPDRARELIRALKTQAQDAIAGVRRLVYGLRPPALDDFGLPGALYEEAARYRDQGLQCVFEAAEPLPPLPAAVEVAAYRIAQEALHNAARHAGAQNCVVRLSAGPDALLLEIEDNGTGIPQDRRTGVGLQSMRERAAELNGLCWIEPRNGGGTWIRAELPIHELPPEEKREHGTETEPM